MKRLLLWPSLWAASVFFVFMPNMAKAQCINTPQFPQAITTLDQTTTTPVTIATNSYTTEYSVVQVNAPGIYTFTVTLNSSGNPGYVTLTDALNNVIAHGPSPFQAPIAGTGQYRVHWTDNAACGNTSANHTTTAVFTSFLGGCIPPLDVTATGITTTSANISWTASTSNPANGYEYVITTTSGAPTGSGTPTTATSFAATTLTPNTQYFVYVRAMCASDTSFWNSFSFLTPCLAVTAPWTEDFEGASFVPLNTFDPCWTTIPTSGGFSYSWWVETDQTFSSATGPSADHTTGVPGAGKYIYVEATWGLAGDQAEIRTPWIDISGITNPTLRFWKHFYGLHIDSFFVEVDTGSGFQTIYETHGPGPQTASTDLWVEEVLSLNDFAGSTTLQIRFRAIHSAWIHQGDLALDDISIDVGPCLNVHTAVTNVTCHGGSDGSINVSISGGTSPYSYLWNTGGTTSSLSNLSEGTYQLTVTDAAGCTQSLPVSINALSTTGVATNITCQGANDGSIDLTISGGAPGYTYAWDNGATGTLNSAPYAISRSSLGPGTYQITVTDANDCTQSLSVSVIQPNALLITGASTNVTNCGANNGSIDLTISGGTPVYTYAWDNGATGTLNSAPYAISRSSLGPGTYRVTVTDANDCTQTLSVSITEPNTLLITSVSTNVTCHGVSDGSINVSISGGTPPYGYLWNTGGTTSSLNNLSEGTYQLTVTDAAGCTQSLPVSINALSATGGVTDITCHGANDGSIDLTISGGTPVYTYAWDNGATGTLNSAPYAISRSSLGPGTYQITVTDANDCTQHFSMSITQPGAALTATTGGVTNVSCFGGDNGALTVTVSGGTSPYSYSWNTGGTTSTLSGLTAGTYRVTVSDNAGCTQSLSMSIAQPNEVVAPWTEDFEGPSFAPFFTFDPCWTTTISPTSYRWGVRTQHTSYSGPSADHTTGVPGAGKYIHIQAWGSAGETAAILTPLINISGITNPTLRFWKHFYGADIDSFFVEIDTGSGFQTIYETHGPGPQTARTNPWVEEVLSLNDFAGSTALQIRFRAIRGAGFYGALALDDISVGPCLLHANASVANVSCFGGDNGALTVTVSGGTSPYSYSWNTGGTTSTLSGLTAGTYRVTVSDNAGCTQSLSMSIAQPNEVVAPWTEDFEGPSFAPFFTFDPCWTTTISPTNYRWGVRTQHTSGHTGPSADHTTGVPGAGKYIHIQAWGSAGETAAILTPLINISGITNPTLRFWKHFHGADIDSFFVEIDTGSGFQTIYETHGPGPQTARTNPWVEEVLSLNDFAGSTALQIRFRAIRGGDWRGALALDDISVGPCLHANASVANVSCLGSNDGALTLAVSGGTPPYSYSWNTGATTQALANLTAGDYRVTVSDAAGCDQSLSLSITQPSAPLAAAAGVTHITACGASDGFIALTLSGGIPGYSYVWDNGLTGTLSNAPYAMSRSNLGPGTYQVSVTDLSGCREVFSYTITEPGALTVSASSVTQVSCFGGNDGTLTLAVSGGTPPYSYLWNTGGTTSSLSGLSAGTYQVTVTDVNGCTQTLSVSITQPSATLAATAGVTNPSCFGGNDGMLTLTVSGGTSPYSYSWNTGGTTSILSGLSAGTYQVTVTDANDCAQHFSMSITQPGAALTATTGVTNVSCFGGDNGALTVTVSGGTSPYSYSWNTGGTTSTLSGLTAGTYRVTVSDNAGCTQSLSMSIAQPNEVVAPWTEDFEGPSFAPFFTFDPCWTTTISPTNYRWGVRTQHTSGHTGPSADHTTGVPGAGKYIHIQAWGSAGETAAILTPLINISGITNPTLRFWKHFHGADIDSFFVEIDTGSGFQTIYETHGPGPQTARTNPWVEEVLSLNDFAGSTALQIRFRAIRGGDWRGALALDDISVGPCLHANASVANVSCLGSNDGALTLAVSGGTPPYSYSWNTGATTQALANLTAGDYRVTVSDAAGCDQSLSLSITQPSAPLAAAAGVTHITACGASDGFIALTLSGGIPGYSYVWDNGLTGTLSNAPYAMSRSNLGPGTYQVSVTDLSGCREVFSYTITEPGALTVSASSVTQVSCFGGNDGTLTLAVSGGTPPYSYLWNTGGTTSSLSGLSAGTYQVTVTDVNGCTQTLSVSITQPSATLAATAGVTNPSCFGGNDGMLTLTVSGGTSPYSYSWNTGGTTSILSGLSAGTYQVTVTDANDCAQHFSMSITQPGAALTATTGVTNVSCFGGDNGALTVTVSGGTSPYSYSWNTGGTTSTLSGLTAGTYRVTVSDNAGCTQSLSMSIAQPNEVVAPWTEDFEGPSFAPFFTFDPCWTTTISPTNYRWGVRTQHTSGHTGPSADHTTGVPGAGKYIHIQAWGSAGETAAILTPLINISGITNPTLRFWKHFHGADIDSFFVEIDTGSGFQTIYETHGPGPQTARTNPWVEEVLSLNDFAGSTALQIRFRAIRGGDWRGALALDDISVGPCLHANASVANVSCLGSNDGALTLAVSGGTPPYSYSWNTGATTQALANLTAGDYRVTVSDAAGCDQSLSLSITQPSAPLAVAAGVTHITACGASDGFIALTLSGGIPGYSYVWDNGLTGTLSNAPYAISRSNLGPGTYQVSVTDLSGCREVFSYTITEPGALTVSASSVTQVSCFGGNDGTLTLAVSGGTPPYSYLWNTGGTTSSLSGLSAGTYQVTVTDVNGCTQTLSVSITQPSATLAATAGVTNPSCFGGNDGMLTLTVSGGTSPYSYSWNTGGTTSTLSGLSAGTYQVTVTDANDCAQHFSMSITQLGAALTATTGVTNVSCFGGDNGALTVTVSGGTSPYSYSWNTGGTTSTLSGLTAGTYRVTVSDNAGCTQSLSMSIAQPNEVVAPWTEDFEGPTFAPFFTFDPCWTTTISPTNYRWGVRTQHTSGHTGPSADHTTGVPGAGKYIHIQAWGSAGDTAAILTPLINISGITNPTLRFWKHFHGADIDSFFVEIDTGSGFQTIYETHGPGPQTARTNPWVEEVLSLNDFAGSTALQIRFRAIRGGDWRGALALDDISVGPCLHANASVANVSCLGSNDGALTLAVSGGTPPYSYSWNTGATTQALANLTAGDYRVTVSDAAGCDQSLSLSITQPSAPLAAAAGVTHITACGASDGFIALTLSGGIPGYSYVWDNGLTGTLSNAPYAISRSNLGPGTYQVSVTDLSGCREVFSYTITEPGALTVSASSVTQVSCFGGNDGTLTLAVSGGTPPYSYLWNTGGTTSSLSGLSAGTYQVTVTDVNGCTQTLSVSITQPSATLAATAGVTHITACGASDGFIALTLSGGIPGYSYVWDNGLTGTLSNAPYAISRNDLDAETYHLSVTDFSGCREVFSYTITEPGALTVSASSVTQVSCFGGNDGALTLAVSGGTPPYSYLWNTGGTTSSLSGLSAGTYQVTVTDVNGCTQTLSVSITQPSGTLAATAGVTHITACGASDGFIALTLSGGIPGYSYVWDNGLTGTLSNAPYAMSRSNLGPGTYQVSVTDVSGCREVFSYTITEPTPITIDITVVDQVLWCNNYGHIYYTISGGSGTYIDQTWDRINPDGSTTTWTWNTNTIGYLVDGFAGHIGYQYAVTITDSQGCTGASDTVTISVMPPLDITTNLCGSVGAINNLSITVNGGGTMPYSYLWNDPGGSTTPQIDNLTPGTYTVSITQVDVTYLPDFFISCDTAVSYTIPASGLTLLTVSPGSATHVSSFGGNDGALAVTVSGGTPPYSYLWNTGHTNLGLNNLTAGTYQVTVTDANGCQQAFSYTITQPAPPPGSIVPDDNAHNDGATNTIETGESLPYSNAWEMHGEYADSAQVLDVGMEGSDLARHINLYPNPTADEVFIGYDFTSEVDLEVTVVNNVGQVVLTTRELNAVSGKLRLDAAEWANGLYSVFFSNGSQSNSRKLVIQK